MKRTLLLLIMGLVCTSLYVSAQQRTVTGRVTGVETGDPLGGVTVAVQGSTTQSQTDAEGAYTISVQQGQTLIFQSVGFQTAERVVGTASVIDVALSPSAEALEEVVVTAMGITREKRALGYAVQDIQSDELLRNKDPNLINSLNGKIAGVNITNSGGAPGSSSSIVLRGGTSLERDNQPLFVIDGMPMDNSTGQGDNSAFDGTVNLSTTNSNRGMDVNPEDIESISVLKGPAAAALYGLRAAAGAIIITTKKGKAGTISVTATPRFITNWVNRLPEQQGSYKRGSYYSGEFTDQTIRSWGDEFGAGETVYDNMGNFFETAYAYDNSFTVSGGTEKSNFFMSASNLAQSGVVPTTDFNRSTVRFNGEQKAGRFTFGVNASYAKSETRKTLTGSGLWGSNSGGYMESIVSWPRNDDMSVYLNPDGTKHRIWPDPNLEDAGDVENPYWIINRNPQTDETNRFIGTAYTNVNVTDWFDITYRLGIDNFTTVFGNRIYPGSSVKLDWQEGMISETNRNYSYINSNLMLNFHKNINDSWDLGLLLGMTSEDTQIKSTSLRAQKFEIPNFFSLNNAEQGNKFFSHDIMKRRLLGVYGDLRVAYRDMLYLSVTGRNDWSSTLPLENRSFFYPSVSGSFVFTELMEPNDFLSFGKIRASWAQVGKDAPAYQTNTYLFGPELSIGGGFRNSWTRGNDILKPETTTSTEVGAELRFLDNRLGADIAYYVNNSKDQILQPRVSNATGYILSYVNTGEIENKGIEVSLTGSPIKRDNFIWDVTLNFSHNNGKVKALPGALPILYVTDVQVGNAKAASFDDGDFMGLSGSKWQTDDDGNLLLNWDTGYPLTGTLTTLPVGNREPDFLGGLNNNFSFKNWNFSFLIDFRKGGDVYNGTEHLLVNYGLAKVTEQRGSTISFTGMSLNPTTEAYESVTREVVADERYYRDIYLNNAAFFIEDVNWLRLRSVSLAYSLPGSALAKMPYVKGATITATGTNLLLFTNYSGMDPETSAAGAGVIGSGSVGIDYAGVPATAGFAVGLNVRF